MSLYEVTEAASLIQEEAHEDANIIFGAVIDERLADEIRITVIATGFGDLATRYNPRYSSSGAPITAPIQAAATRPVDPATVHPTAPTLPPPPPQPQQRMFGGKPVRRMGMIVDDGLDIPAFKRRGADPNAMLDRSEPNELGDQDDKLDIPTFLRKHLE
jgi:cell division protein FtsZ